MSQWLQRASKAVREQHDGNPGPAAEHARRQVWARSHELHERRSRWLVWLVPVVALAGSAAYAKNAERVAHWVTSKVQVWSSFAASTAETERQASHPSNSPATRRTSGISAVPSSITPSFSVMPTAALPSTTAPSRVRPTTPAIPPARESEPARPSRARHLATPPTAPDLDKPDLDKPDLDKPDLDKPDLAALYRTAHRLHFTDSNHAEALTAWNAYLEAAPHGMFALEARYNRAICFVKLGHHASARRALAPFARGEYGEYRRDEARHLMNSPPVGGE